MADRTPMFLAMKRTLGPSADCARCHAPFEGRVDSRLPISREAITCEACHLLRQVVPVKGGAKLEHELQDNVMYGPFCDLPDNYFHKLGCSPLHAESTFCGGCHLYYVPTVTGGSLPVFTEYEEWSAAAEKAAPQSCQSCHMPEGTAEIAVGADARIGVGHHGFFGDKRGLRRTALAVTADLRQSSGGIELKLRVSNSTAQHSVPTGLPGRRVVVTVVAKDPTGAQTDRQEYVFARILSDATGREVPFYAASQVGSDTRLVAEETRVLPFHVRAHASGSLRIEVEWQAMSPELARQLELRAPREPMRSLDLEFGPRKPLPREAKLK